MELIDAMLALVVLASSLRTLPEPQDLPAVAARYEAECAGGRETLGRGASGAAFSHLAASPEAPSARRRS